MVLAFCSARAASCCGKVNTTWKYSSTGSNSAPVRPTTWRAPHPDTSDNCGSNTSCIRGRDVRNRNTSHGHPRWRCGNHEYPRRLSSAVGRARNPSEPENRLRVCGKHRPLRADVRSLLWVKCAGRLDDVERVQQLQRAGGGTGRGVRDMEVASGGLQFRVAEQNLNAAEVH